MSVLKDWVTELPLMMQGTLLTSIRGNDTAPTPGIKKVGRWYRDLLLHNGNPENDFMEFQGLPRVEDIHDELEYSSVHYLLHLLHGLEIVGYKHPDPETSDIALDYYLRIVHWLHLSPETEQELDERLSGEPGTTGETKKWVRKKRRNRRVEPAPEPPAPAAPVHIHHGGGS